MDFQDIEGAITDAFIICSGTSERHVAAIADNICREFKVLGELPSHIEGTTLNKWILIDFQDVVVHIFQENMREFYQLEKLWHNARVINPE